MILSALGLVAFVAACFVVGLGVNKLKHARFVRAWQPLVPVIGGTVHQDPLGGGASSWLVGTWKGYVVHARMSPDTRSTEASNYRSMFAVGVAEVDGSAHWRADSRVRSDDPVIQRQLGEAGVLERMRAAVVQEAMFDRHARTLFIEEDVYPAWCPHRERFIALLDLATDLARINAQVNRR
jgi:hypothetical protein